MFEVIFCLIAGILVGFLLRNKENLIRLSDRAGVYAIYLLLFLLGLSAGGNKTVLSSFASLGWMAFVLTTGGIAGSVLLSWVVYRHFFRVRK